MLGKDTMRRIVTCLISLLVIVVIVGCGSVSEPIWELAGTETQAAVAAQQATDIALGLPTSAPPTSTPIPTATLTPTPEPTATTLPTDVPPTATATLAPTSTPVPTATTAPTTASVGASDVAVPLPDGFADLVAAADPADGEAVFNRTISMPDGAVWSCSQCHSITPDEARLIGPGQWNVAVRAETRVEGQNALTYLYNSILHPNAFITPPDASGAAYPANLMPQYYSEVLTEEELASVIAYLETLQE
jgi:mono/diheme cytochrome c family protein